MTIKTSTQLRTHMLDAGSLANAFGSTGELRIYSGAEPATADAAAGTLLSTIKKDGSSGISFAAAANGAISKANETWTGNNAASGQASYYRLVVAADTNEDDASNKARPRIQGKVAAAPASDVDLVLSSVALVSGQAQNIDYYTITFPTN